MGSPMSHCKQCGNAMNIGWLACPFCGWKVEEVMNSDPTILELAKRSSCGGCDKDCSGKKKRKVKSKCCKRYENKKKAKGRCKSCPEIVPTLA